MILKDSCIFTPSVGNKDGSELGQRALLLGGCFRPVLQCFPFTFTSISPQTSASNLPRDIVSLVLTPYGSNCYKQPLRLLFSFFRLFIFLHLELPFILLCLSLSRFRLCNCCHGYWRIFFCRVLSFIRMTFHRKVKRASPLSRLSVISVTFGASTTKSYRKSVKFGISVHPSVCPHVEIREYLNRFSLNLVLECTSSTVGIRVRYSQWRRLLRHHWTDFTFCFQRTSYICTSVQSSNIPRALLP